MTPAELDAALKALTGDVRGIAPKLGYTHRNSVYAMLDGRMPIKPETETRIAELLRERRDAIDDVLGRLGCPRPSSRSLRHDPAHAGEVVMQLHVAAGGRLTDAGCKMQRVDDGGSALAAPQVVGE